MARFHLCFILIAAGAFCMAAGRVGSASGEDFRVENTVYAGDEKEPSSESTTIFYRGVVYDCMKTPAETVVFDKVADRFELLNVPHRTHRVDHRPFGRFCPPVADVGRQKQGSVGAVLADPKFDERFQDAANELTLSSPLVTYRLVLSPESDQSVVEQYREFCDSYAAPQRPVGSRLAAAVRTVGRERGDGPATGHGVAGIAEASPRARYRTSTRPSSAASIAWSARWVWSLRIGWLRPAR